MPKSISRRDQIAMQLSPYVNTKLQNHQLMTKLCQQLKTFMIKMQSQGQLTNQQRDELEQTYLNGQSASMLNPIINQWHQTLQSYQVAILETNLAEYASNCEDFIESSSRDLKEMYLGGGDLTPLDIQIDDLTTLLKQPITNDTIDDFFKPFKDRETISVIANLVNNIYDFELKICTFIIVTAEEN